MNSLSSRRSPQEFRSNRWLAFAGRLSSNCSCRRPDVIDQTIPPTDRQYLPAVLLHQSSAFNNDKLTPQILLLFDIFPPLPDNSSFGQSYGRGDYERMYYQAGCCRCARATNTRTADYSGGCCVGYAAAREEIGRRFEQYARNRTRWKWPGESPEKLASASPTSTLTTIRRSLWSYLGTVRE
jgi:hypothetical protein